MEDWEVSKENYQPLKAGRKPDTLRAFGTVAQDASIEEQRRYARLSAFVG